MLTAATLAWARSLGEFGPILVFAGATRGRTEVLSTSVFLEINIGNLRGAVCISLLMILLALAPALSVSSNGLKNPDELDSDAAQLGAEMLPSDKLTESDFGVGVRDDITGAGFGPVGEAHTDRTSVFDQDFVHRRAQAQFPACIL